MTHQVQRQALYPMPTPQRRRIVQRLSEITRTLDDEAGLREILDGQHDRMIADELRRAAGSLRFVATLVVQGGMSTARASFWTVAASDYLALVQRADRSGVIR